MSKLDWRRARKFAGAEMKYLHGKVLDDGRVIHHAPRDALDVQAREAEHRWLHKRGLDPDLVPKQWPTEAEIIAARTNAGGWTRETLARWGVPWPPPKGWRRALVARDVRFFKELKR
jgi:hypothetical protein